MTPSELVQTGPGLVGLPCRHGRAGKLVALTPGLILERLEPGCDQAADLWDRHTPREGIPRSMKGIPGGVGCPVAARWGRGLVVIYGGTLEPLECLLQWDWLNCVEADWTDCDQDDDQAEPEPNA